MKRKIFSILFALVLVVGLSLMPAVPVSAAEGDGTAAISPPDDVVAGSTGTWTVTYTVPADNMTVTGGIKVTIPAGWTVPQTDNASAAGYVTCNTTGVGTVSASVSDSTITVTLATDNLTASDNISVVYGDTSGGANPDAVATAQTTAQTDVEFTVTEDLDANSTFTAIASPPTLNVIHDSLHHFLVVTEHAGTEVAGTAFSVNVTAQDQYNNIATSYNGTAVSITFTSTATAAPSGTSPTIPSPESLDFSATPGIVTATGFILVDAGETPTITASDSTYEGTSNAITVNPADAASLSVTGITDPITKGASSNVTVTAYDPYQNVATSYNGTIAFTSTDTAAAFAPATYAFQASDNGTHLFTNGVTFNTVGQHSVTATDNATPAITGTQSGIGVYDKLITLNVDGWTLVSTDDFIIYSGDNTSGFEGSVVSNLIYRYTGSGFLTATVAHLKPVEAIYVKTTGSDGQLGLNYDTDATPGASIKSLVEGWNLVSSANITAADIVLSPLHYVQVGEQQGVGLATLVSQGDYNLNTASWYIDATTWSNLAGNTMDPFDGYWVYMNAAKSFGVIPQ